jgi:hypothetical protein
MNIKQLLGIVLIALVLVPSVALAIDESELGYSVEIDRVYWWQRLFTGDSFSTSISDGSRDTARADQYIDVTYRYRCEEAATKQKFTLGYSIVGSPVIAKITDSKTVSQACTPGQVYDAKIRNTQFPELQSGYCGNVVLAMVKHERYTNGQWVVDTDTVSGNIQGFERVSSWQYECQSNPCDGLTGETIGSQFCVGDDIGVKQYTNLVKNGQCITNNKIVKNCLYSCVDATCVIENIEGYRLRNNQCESTFYPESQSKPSNFYTTKSSCESQIVVEDTTDTTTDTTDTTDSDTTIDTNTDVNTTQDTSDNTGNTDTRNIFQKIWAWIIGLFSI